jgi:hypothetical protein
MAFSFMVIGNKRKPITINTVIYRKEKHESISNEFVKLQRKYSIP